MKYDFSISSEYSNEENVRSNSNTFLFFLFFFIRPQILHCHTVNENGDEISCREFDVDSDLFANRPEFGVTKMPADQHRLSVHQQFPFRIELPELREHIARRPLRGAIEAELST